MSTTTSNTATPARSGASSPTITPLHDPAHQAQIIKPAPLGTSHRKWTPHIPFHPTEPSLIRSYMSIQTGARLILGIDNNKIVPGQDTTGAAGLGVKALLAKKMAKAKYVSLPVSHMPHLATFGSQLYLGGLTNLPSSWS